MEYSNHPMKIRIPIAAAVAAIVLASCAAQGTASEDGAKLVKGTLAVPFFEDKPQATLTAWDFLDTLPGHDRWEIDEMVISAVCDGQVPDELRSFRRISYVRDGHVVELWVLPDYVSVGTSEDYCRMPMGPIGAQRIADSLNCCLPTAFLVDRINDVAEGHLDIFPFRPYQSRNEFPYIFADSNNAIKALYKAYGYKFGQFISGLKKDIVYTVEIEDNPKYARNVAIYGWHHPDGHPQQPLFVRHGNFYADYSHGARMIYRAMTIDGEEHDLKEVMCDPELFRLVSDEEHALKHASYSWQERW